MLAASPLRRIPGFERTTLALAVAALTALLLGVALHAPGLLPGALPLPAGLLALGLALLAALALLFGPSGLLLAVFIVGLVSLHQFRSPFILPLAGAELHPRELLLLLLLGHAALVLATGRAVLRPDLAHYFFYLYTFFYLLIAATGAFYGAPRSEILEELRFALFTATYFVLVIAAPTPRLLYRFGLLILGLSLAMAAGAVLFFLSRLVTGEVVTAHTWLGEYTRREYFGILLQATRPSGHVFFEVSFVVLVSLIASRALTPAWRTGALAACGLLLAGIALSFMRTAYAATLVGVAALVWLSLPREARSASLVAAVAAAVVGVLLAGSELLASFTRFVPGLDVSLQARVAETQGALAAIAERPLFGHGMGSTFAAFDLVADTARFAYGQGEFQSTHNFWLYILFKGGVFGLLLVLLVFGAILWRGLDTLDRLRDPMARAFLRGCLAVFIAQLVASLAMPRLLYPQGQVLLALLVAAVFVFGYAERHSRSHDR